MTVSLAILIVDDDLSFGKRLGAFLKKEGHHVTHGATGEEGVRLFADHGPDIVLLDMVLPDIDGIQTLKKIKKLNESAAIVEKSGKRSLHCRFISLTVVWR